MNSITRRIAIAGLGALASGPLLSRTHTLDLQAGRSALATWGRKTDHAVLAIHGFPQDPWAWAPMGEQLARQGYRLIAPCQRGYLVSNRPWDLSGYTFASFVSDMMTVADDLNLRHFDVAGFGIGGAVAWMMAAFYPQRIRSLTSIAFPHPAAFAEAMRVDPAFQQQWAHVQEAAGGDPQEKADTLLAQDAAGLRHMLQGAHLPQPFLDAYVARMRLPGALAAALSWSHAISLKEFSQVPQVAVPSLLIWSEGQPFGDTATRLTASYVRARYTEVVLPVVSHYLLETVPRDLVAPVLTHLRTSG